MFYDDVSILLDYAKKSNFTIFATSYTDIIAKNYAAILILRPDETKNKITIDQIREISDKTHTKQNSLLFIVFVEAEKLTLAAANAFLKNLEEPTDNIHYVFFTNSPDQLLPTILSRAEIFYPKTSIDFEAPVKGDENLKNKARELISATPSTLPRTAEYFHKLPAAKKRDSTLTALTLALEILEKSYYKTKNKKILDKISRFLTCYENIASNGHIKLHLVADLI